MTSEEVAKFGRIHDERAAAVAAQLQHRPCPSRSLLAYRRAVMADSGPDALVRHAYAVMRELENIGDEPVRPVPDLTTAFSVVVFTFPRDAMVLREAVTRFHLFYPNVRFHFSLEPRDIGKFPESMFPEVTFRYDGTTGRGNLNGLTHMQNAVDAAIDVAERDGVAHVAKMDSDFFLIHDRLIPEHLADPFELSGYDRFSARFIAGAFYLMTAEVLPKLRDILRDPQTALWVDLWRQRQKLTYIPEDMAFHALTERVGGSARLVEGLDMAYLDKRYAADALVLHPCGMRAADMKSRLYRDPTSLEIELERLRQALAVLKFNPIRL